MLIPIVLAGGLGSRLWPLSRQDYPKHLLKLLGDYSLLQSTLLRAAELHQVSHVMLVCSQQHQKIVQQQLAGLLAQEPALEKITFQFLFEPIGRSTAPAITLAALEAVNIDHQAKLLILPSDHVLTPKEHFIQQVSLACQQLAPTDLLTFGIKPKYAETGYGYIKIDALVDHSGITKILQFIEKPNQEKAEYYYQQPEYYWNSGMFLFHASALISEMKQYAPDIFQACQRMWLIRRRSEDGIFFDQAEYQRCPNQSIDYALMEKTQHAMMLLLQADWYDIGTWTGLADAHPKDNAGNIEIGHVVTDNVTNCYIQSESRLVVALGIEDCIIVETADAILIAKKSEAQKVKQVVNRLNTHLYSRSP